MARVELGDMPDVLDFGMSDLLEVQTNLIISLVTQLEARGIMTRAEFGKSLLQGEKLDKPSGQILTVLGRALASIDPDPPSLKVVD